MTVFPEALAHVGRHAVEGFLLSTELMTEETARERILKIWQPGTRVFRLPQGFVVLLGRVERLRDPWVGTPIVRCHGRLSAIPLSADEVEALGPAAGVVFATNGTATVWIRSTEDEVDPVEWIDAGFHTAALTDLGAPPAAVVGPPERVRRVEREVFKVAEEDGGVAEILVAMQKMNRREAIVEQLPVAHQPSWLDRTIAKMVGWLRRPPALAAGTFETEMDLSATTGSGAGSEPEPLPQPAGPSVWERLARWLEKLAANAAVEAGLGRMIGDRQAEYLEKLLDEFTDGDIAEALRRAIPLGGESESETHPMLRMPTPRQSLDLNLGPRVSSGGSLMTGPSLYETLRKTYLSAAQSLIERERYEEAAFVYADLLGEVQKAVSLLEKHGKYKLAAKLAEARELDVAWIIKLYWLAGEIERAIWIARTNRAFADALRRIGETDRTQADHLRAIWAGLLADAGQYGAAVLVIWPVERLRPSARDWVYKAVALGGPAGAQMLARQLDYFPDTWPDVRRLGLALLARHDPASRRERRSFSEALTTQPATPQTQALVRAALRALVRDSPDVPGQMLVRKLVTASAQMSLSADLPPLSQPELDRDHAPEWAATDVGLSRAFDAIRLPSGDLLVALGESGIARFASDGRLIAHFDLPAASLVADEDGSRAIGLIGRGDHVAICRIDLVTGQAEPWTEAVLTSWCDTFDGDQWLVAAERRIIEDADFSTTCDLLAIETNAEDWRAAWQLPSAATAVLAMHKTEDQLISSLFTDGEEQDWVHDLAGMRLRERRPGHAVPSRNGWRAEVEISDEGARVTVLGSGGHHRLLTLNGSRVVRARVDAEGGVVLCDDRGRVVVYDAVASVLWADIRV